MKKKNIILALGLVVVLGVTACGTGGKSDKAGFDADSEITVVSREDGSGTRGAFIELFGVEEKDDEGNKEDKTTDEAVVIQNTSVMMTTVQGNEAAIGYISLGSLNDTVKAVKINGKEATVANIKDGSYEISRPFNIATKADVSEVTKDFITYILSSDGQAVVDSSGYITLDNPVAYEGTKPSGKIVVAGSSSVTPVMEKLKEAYVKVNTNATIEIQQSDSSTGMSSAIEGTCDIGMASRELKDSETSEGIEATVIALDGIAVIVNNDNTVEDLATEDVKNIFTGATTEWSEFTK